MKRNSQGEGSTRPAVSASKTQQTNEDSSLFIVLWKLITKM
jgi:hypothetical protein